MRRSILSLAITASLLAGCSTEPTAQAELSLDEQRIQARLSTIETDVEKLLSQMTLEEKVSMVHANGKFTIPGITRLGIHEMWMSDGPHGVRHEIERNSWGEAGWTSDFSTYLPPLTAVAASWNLDMAALHGHVLGSEARHRNKDVILGPGVNLARTPLYGRNFEYYGEDPFLAAELVKPAVKAIQANDVAASVKHFALNTQELNRTGVDNRPAERTLREVYLPAFEAGVQAGAWTIMGAYNEYKGTNANQSKELVMDILKGEWGYQGVLLTDWNVDINTKDAALHGLDIEMGTDVPSYDDYFMAKPLLEAIKRGEIQESVVDDKVRRILRVQHAIGMYDKHRISGERNTQAHRDASREIATQGVVLLKNEEHTLPLNADNIKKVLLVGPNVAKQHAWGGGSSQVKTWHEVTPLEGIREQLGDDVVIEVLRARGTNRIVPIAADYIASRHWTGTPSWEMQTFKDASFSEALSHEWVTVSSYDFAKSNADHVELKGLIKPLTSGKHTFQFDGKGVTSLIINGETHIEELILDGTTEYAINLEADQEYSVALRYQGQENITLGWQAPGSPYSPVEEYQAAARNADAVIYIGGLSHSDDREGIDRPDMKMPAEQDDVISNLIDANENTVVLLIGGSAVEMPWANKAKAILWGWYGGSEAGHVFADIIFGDKNPSGKMPFTLPKTLEDTAAIALDDYNSELVTYKEGVFIGHRWFEQQNIEPIFAFGHGLSYTEFSYDSLSVKASDNDGELYNVSVNVSNTGSRQGAEVIQLYIRDIESSVVRPLKELKGFSRLELSPGETKTASISLDKRAFSFWDSENDTWKLEPGEFEILVGSSSDNITLTEKVSIN